MLVAFECKFEKLHTIINISQIVLMVSNIDSMREGGGWFNI